MLEYVSFSVLILVGSQIVTLRRSMNSFQNLLFIKRFVNDYFSFQTLTSVTMLAAAMRTLTAQTK